MAFGPDFFEPEAESPAQNNNSNKSAGRPGNAPASNKGAIIALVIGAIMAIIGITYGSLIVPDAEGTTKLAMLGVGVVGIIVVGISAKKTKRR